jgi:NADH:ubiquinone oxidoreductase subunit F (NADH-binding)
MTIKTPARKRQPDPPTPSSGLPRLLDGVKAEGALSLSEHTAIHGELPSPGRRERRGAEALIDQIEQAGLSGRGGASFPMARKMRAVVGSRGRPIVVVNATEGEPASLKDRTLIETLPHLVLDGAVLAARAIGAEEVHLCVCESAGAGLQRCAQALSERARLAGQWPRVLLTPVPEAYIIGHESALVSHLNGGPAKPTFSPPMLYERGVRRRPTLVNNAETLAHVALIARYGPRWFRELGVAGQPGSTLVSLSGPVAYPGVYEIEYGASLTSLLEAAGGTTAAARAALFGGYAGGWVDGHLLSGIALSDEHLAPHGVSLGAGVVLLLSDTACPVAETVHVARWLARQSAGQCGPCVHGLDSIAAALERIAGGTRERHYSQRLADLAALTAKRGACSHPDGAVRFVTRALEVFEHEFADHARHGPCDACASSREMPLPARAGRARAA